MAVLFVSIQHNLFVYLFIYLFIHTRIYLPVDYLKMVYQMPSTK